jgi:hypothetical protein
MEPKNEQQGQIKVDLDPSLEKVNIEVGDHEDIQVRTDEKIERIEILETSKAETVEIHTPDEEIDITIKKDHHEKPKETRVEVNNKPVVIDGRDATGSKIKADAILQGVNIKQDFNLFEREVGELKPVADDKIVKLHQGQEFRAVAPDDNSEI